MTQALPLAAAAYRQADLFDLTSFSQTDFPYVIARDLINEVVQEINNNGDYWFTESVAALPYAVSKRTWNLTTEFALPILPHKVTRVYRGIPTNQGALKQLNYFTFTDRFGFVAPATLDAPKYYTIYGNVLTVECFQPSDQALLMFYQAGLPQVSSETDGFSIPLEHENVIRLGILAKLLNRMGRQDMTIERQYLAALEGLQKDAIQNRGLPRQMPAGF